MALAPNNSTTAPTERRTRWARWSLLAAVYALVVVVLAWETRSGMWEGASSNAADSYYNLLVQGFRAGQLNLKREVPPGFARLADPYDPGANSEYRMAARQPLHDMSYYKGRLYLYFGITPALVLFWPFVALTGHYLLHRCAVLFFCSVAFLAGAGLLCAVWRRYFAQVSVGVVAAGILALGLANLVPAILPVSDFYEVALSAAYASLMLALIALWRAFAIPEQRGRWLAVASLAYGLAVGARPSVLFGAAILLLPVAQTWRARRKFWVQLLAATVPLLLIGLGLMLYNAIRFDNPFEFGQRYQLSYYRQDKVQHFGLGYFWFNFRLYSLQPARWSLLFPFAHDISMPPLPPGRLEVEHPFGVLTNIPFVWLALAAPLAWRRRSPEARSVLRGFLAAVALLFTICALTIGCYYYVSIRLEWEFVPPLVFLAVMGVFAVERVSAANPAWRRLARLAWALLLAFSIAFNLFASFGRRAENDSRLGRIFFHRGQVSQAISNRVEIRPRQRVGPL